MAQGHKVALYCYAPPDGVPDGIELRDAAQILPRDLAVPHFSGSYALFADRFRYELLARGLGTWIDCDVYFIARMPLFGPVVMGDQGDGTINGAVLRLPPESAMLQRLRGLFDGTHVPPWLRWRPRLAARARRALTGRAPIEDMPWGTAGPEALTWLARDCGLERLAQPARIFYPVPWIEAGWLCDSARPLETVISADTVAVHLWNERLKAIDLAAAPEGSFAARLLREGAQ